MPSPSANAQDYDVIVVGGGPAGLFAAYYLSEHSDCRVLLIEKGKGPQKRKCPITETQHCIDCKPCNILSGIGGAGLFSDGNVHSHLDHLKGLIRQAKTEGVTKIRIHTLLDGRDVGETSALEYIDPFEEYLSALNKSDVDYRIASGGGRMVLG